MPRIDVAATIDHTILAPDAGRGAVEDVCREAVAFGAASVCVSPTRVALARHVVGDDFCVATVVGFPSGAHLAVTKAAEAAALVALGADEIDMVAPVAAAIDGDWDTVAAHVAAVRAAVPRAVLKVIVESAALDDDGIVTSCRAAEDAGADYVKTSTGFHPAGGATLHAVELMRATVGLGVGVKASGGIRDAATALAMLEAGANRLGTSSTGAILAGLDDA